MANHSVLATIFSFCDYISPNLNMAEVLVDALLTGLRDRFFTHIHIYRQMSEELQFKMISPDL